MHCRRCVKRPGGLSRAAHVFERRTRWTATVLASPSIPPPLAAGWRRRAGTVDAVCSLLTPLHQRPRPLGSNSRRRAIRLAAKVIRWALGGGVRSSPTSPIAVLILRRRQTNEQSVQVVVTFRHRLLPDMATSSPSGFHHCRVRSHARAGPYFRRLSPEVDYGLAVLRLQA